MYKNTWASKKTFQSQSQANFQMEGGRTEGRTDPNSQDPSGHGWGFNNAGKNRNLSFGYIFTFPSQVLLVLLLFS